MTNVWRATSTADEVLSGIDLHGKRVLVTGVSAGFSKDLEIQGVGFKAADFLVRPDPDCEWAFLVRLDRFDSGNRSFFGLLIAEYD